MRERKTYPNECVVGWFNGECALFIRGCEHCEVQVRLVDRNLKLAREVLERSRDEGLPYEEVRVSASK